MHLSSVIIPATLVCVCGNDCDFLVSPTVAVRPFSSYPHDDRRQGHRYDSIDSF